MLLTGLGSAFGQHSISIRAVLNDSLKTLEVEQELTFHNHSQDSLREIFLQDWNNAFRDKSTPLAVRFSENYNRRFHFAREDERGSTTIRNIAGENRELEWERPARSADLIRIRLNSPLLPGQSYTIQLEYQVKIPSHKFTRFGYADNGNYKLKHWFLTPGVYDDGWNIYSHKDLNDKYHPKMDLQVKLKVPSYLAVISALNTDRVEDLQDHKIFRLSGKNRMDTSLFLTNQYLFQDIDTGYFNILTNLWDNHLNPGMKNYLAGRVSEFLDRRLGDYPHDLLLATEEDYAANPMYGLNQLPKFIRPFPDGFNYDLKLFKTVSGNYLENTLLLNPRKDKWIFDAIQIYLLMDYVDENYPGIKIMGNLSEIIGIRWFHAADLEFNEQYPYLYMHMARLNMDQALSTPRDSLLKFNNNIANAYKAGVGLKYLDEFLGDNTVSNTIDEFYSRYRLQPVTSLDFSALLQENATKDIDWFFESFVSTNKKIDFRIKKVEQDGDSLEVTIKNKTGTNVPISLYGLREQEVVNKTWVEDVLDTRVIKIPKAGINRLALNYEAIIPEINQRDNYKGVNSFLDKPLQLRLLKDVEDPRYTQLFVMPEFQYNLYDGISLGPKLYNSTILPKNFEFGITPLYGFNSQTMVGGGSFRHVIPFQNQELYSIMYGASASRFSYGYGRFYERLSPFLILSFRSKDLRDPERRTLRIRSVNVMRDQDPLTPIDAPSYSVFNVDYRYSKKGMVDYFTGSTDFQLAQQFSKFSITAEYRKLFKNNQQINLRFFAGAFLYNDLSNTDYFSFALDRPTDYLFDYNYYGRSETSGLFSQQIIMAEGGFKSQLEPEFANQWITTFNGSTNIWKWIYAYGDLGLVKNRDHPAQFLYDSGIRLSFIADYFEIYFPVYSNLGWEMSQENYDQKIRFIATLDLPTLLGLFSREWY